MEDSPDSFLPLNRLYPRTHAVPKRYEVYFRRKIFDKGTRYTYFMDIYDIIIV